MGSDYQGVTLTQLIHSPTKSCREYELPTDQGMKLILGGEGVDLRFQTEWLEGYPLPKKKKL